MGEPGAIDCDSTFDTWVSQTGHRPGAAHWSQAYRWERDHVSFDAEHGRRRRVMCIGHADLFDSAAPEGWRVDVFETMARTPHVDWLVVTQHIGNAAAMLDQVKRSLWMRGTGTLWPLPNVWLGVAVANQAEVDHDVPQLLSIEAACRFVSIEPMLGPVSLLRHLMAGDDPGACRSCGKSHGFTRANAYGAISKLRGSRGAGDVACKAFVRANFAIDWVVASGQVGPAARPMHPAWMFSLRDQCESAGVPLLFKAWGDWAPSDVGLGEDLYRELARGSLEFVRADGRPSDGQIRQGDALMRRVGKAKAGRRVAGKLFDAWPAAAVLPVLIGETA